MAVKNTTIVFKTTTQFLVIVNLTIADDGKPTIATQHGLSADLREIVHGGTAMAQAEAAILRQKDARGIGFARGHVVARSDQFLPVNGVSRVVIGEDAVDAAHVRR